MFVEDFKLKNQREEVPHKALNTYVPLPIRMGLRSLQEAPKSSYTVNRLVENYP